MAKRLTRAQLLVILAGGLLLLGWTWWNTRRMQQARVEFQQLVPSWRQAEPVVSEAEDGHPLTQVWIEPQERGAPGERWFWVRVGDQAWDLPYPTEEADEAAWAAWQAGAASILEQIRIALAAARGDAAADREVLGEIRTPARAEQGVVPPGLVVRVLDLFLSAGYQDVAFEGAPPALDDD